MKEMLGKFGIDGEAFKLAYMFGKDQGRSFLKGALTFPGIRLADLEKAASLKGVDVKGLIAKRDAMLDAMVAFFEELFGLDG